MRVYKAHIFMFINIYIYECLGTRVSDWSQISPFLSSKIYDYTMYLYKTYRLIS